MTTDITWQALRALADKVQGRQDREQYVSIDDNGLHHSYAAPPTPAVRVPAINRKDKVTRVQVLVPNATFKDLQPCSDPSHVHPLHDLACLGDALFWSMAAVEKFLLPYYASFWGLEKITADIRTQFERDDVLAVLHRPDSEPTLGGAAKGPGDTWPTKSLTLLVRTSKGLVFTAFPSAP